MFSFRITSISTAEPVTVADLKTHLRIQTTAEDTLLDAYITAARQVAEGITKRSLVQTQWELTIDDFNSSVIELPYGAPLNTAATDVVITYTKTTGDTTTLPSTCYVIEHRAEPGFIRLPYESEWPDDVQATPGAVRISYRSGYSTATSLAPEGIKLWIKMRAGQMYEYREPLITGANLNELRRDFVDGLLDPWRLPNV